MPERQAEGDLPGVALVLLPPLGPRGRPERGLHNPRLRSPESARGSLLLQLLALEHARRSLTSPPSAPMKRRKSKHLQFLFPLIFVLVLNSLCLTLILFGFQDPDPEAGEEGQDPCG